MTVARAPPMPQGDSCNEGNGGSSACGGAGQAGAQRHMQASSRAPWNAKAGEGWKQSRNARQHERIDVYKVQCSKLRTDSGRKMRDEGLPRGGGGAIT